MLFRSPAGMLLLPDGADEVATALATGREVVEWPTGTEFMRRALDEDIDQAVADLSGDDLVSRYNRAVLVGGEGVWESLARDTTGELRALVDVARFSIGQTDEPPADGYSSPSHLCSITTEATPTISAPNTIASSSASPTTISLLPARLYECRALSSRSTCQPPGLGNGRPSFSPTGLIWMASPNGSA